MVSKKHITLAAIGIFMALSCQSALLARRSSAKRGAGWGAFAGGGTGLIIGGAAGGGKGALIGGPVGLLGGALLGWGIGRRRERKGYHNHKPHHYRAKKRSRNNKNNNERRRNRHRSRKYDKTPAA